VLPDILRASAEPIRVGLLDPAAARTLAARYGVFRWPSLVFLRDGAYLGALERMRDWGEYLEEIPRILARPASQPPTSPTAAPDSSITH
jgi:hydrogenase-1 operon protein HyaE